MHTDPTHTQREGLLQNEYMRAADMVLEERMNENFC